jgi:hypothetical protein
VVDVRDDRDVAQVSARLKTGRGGRGHAELLELRRRWRGSRRTGQCAGPFTRVPAASALPHKSA